LDIAQSLNTSAEATASEEQTNSAPKRAPKPQRGAELTIRTHSFAFEGKAVGRREDGYVIFTEGALANELIRVEVTRAKGQFAEAKLLEVLEPSSERVVPPCPYFGICGGCALQHMSYPAQVYWKGAQVRELFERIGKFENPNVLPVLTSAGREFQYRNKMEFSFSSERWLLEEEIAGGDELDRFALGMHVRNRFDRVLDTHSCLLPKAIAVEIMNFSRAFARDHNLGVFDPDKNPEGLVRFLVVRTSEATPDVMVNLVTSRSEPKIMEKFAKELRERVPGVTTMVNTINGKRAQVATGDAEHTIFGPGTIRDSIGTNQFQISAQSFFQTNTLQAEKLYQAACEAAELKRDDILWDLYCGTGTITLFAAHLVKHVLGVELVESAISDARANALSNSIANVEFVASDLRKALTTPEFLSQYARPTAMIIDPPRSGMHPEVVKEVVELAPERIAYISCNPATQARDIDLMRERYELISIEPVDMFPQTFHIESVAKLRRK
jgi:23S rRNA (uracil1939-C5)-methyltransferase